ncbi:MAG TPA: hypothetical protein VN944_10870 [Nitrospiria bacterium]|nr:hypothetical protein [Nitrospiria bacterium]
MKSIFVAIGIAAGVLMALAHKLRSPENLKSVPVPAWTRLKKKI